MRTPAMRPITLKSAARQVADHLRTEIQRLSLTGGLPGPRTLAERLGVNHKTVEVALDLLEEEGVILAQGPGRRRKIQPLVEPENKPLRIQLLMHGRRDNSASLLTEVLHRLREAGHAVTVGERRVSDYLIKKDAFLSWVESRPTDAWVLHAPPAELLEWFVQRAKPVFAISGGLHGMPVAGGSPDKTPAMREAVERLVGLGHRNIAMIGRKERLKAAGGNYEQAFLAELTRHGLPAGRSRLPTWNNQPSGFHRCLQNLMQQVAPTALIIDEAPLYIAVQQFLAQRGLSAPQDLSLICMQRDPYFDWCRPSVAHFLWDGAPLTRRALQWAHHLACGKPDIKQASISTSYVNGGTVGPVPIQREPETTAEPAAELAEETV